MPAPAQDAGTSVEPATTPLPALSGPPPAWRAFELAWAGIAAYTATVTFFERKDARVQNTVLDYGFRKPSSATVHIIKGPNAGVTLEWSGGDTVVAHRGSGLLAMFKKKYALHDPLATTIRGSSVDQLSFAAILSHAQDTPGAITEAPGPVIDGIPTAAVTLIPTSSVADTGLTREVVAINSLTNIPMRVLGYDGPILVRQVDFSSIKLELAPL
jgi:hypothetical protein